MTPSEIPWRDLSSLLTDELRADIQARPSVFLSASVMDPRRASEADKPAAPAAEVRDAVIQVAQTILARGWNLVFGGHPAISPLVLGIASRLQKPGTKRIIVFQSDLFEAVIPQATRELWNFGHLIATPVASGFLKDPANAAAREASLLLMRNTMLSLRPMIGAIFIGGMKGVKDEAKLVAPDVPCFAIPSTGSAAEDLFDADPERYSGGPPKPPTGTRLREALERRRPNAVIASLIADRIAP